MTLLGPAFSFLNYYKASPSPYNAAVPKGPAFSFLNYYQSAADDMAVDPALGATTPAHTANDTSPGRKRDNASSNDADADASVATAGDAADTASAIPPPSDTADGAADGAHAFAVADDKTRRCERRKPHVGPAQAARIRKYEQESLQPGRSGGCKH